VRACLRFCDSQSNALRTVFSDCKLLLTENVLQRIEDEDEFEDEDDLVAARPLCFLLFKFSSSLPSVNRTWLVVAASSRQSRFDSSR
jgi:hypothetical protein